MWGIGNGIALLSFVCIKCPVGFSFTCGFVSSVSMNFMMGKSQIF